MEKKFPSARWPRQPGEWTIRCSGVGKDCRLSPYKPTSRRNAGRRRIERSAPDGGSTARGFTHRLQHCRRRSGRGVRKRQQLGIEYFTRHPRHYAVITDASAAALFSYAAGSVHGPVRLAGIVMAMLPGDTPMGFVALLGVIALAGMIIRNAVILITEVDGNQAQGMESDAAIIAAAEHRARPIFLTPAPRYWVWSPSLIRYSGDRWRMPSLAG
ncbi:RND efflux transporter [Klebsiella michiganensis]|uniref:RND efflux transporter n=1 Tax=Klebsiella michiganensis TaxID=1134687 RepID=A0A7H4LV87_9ENTR|nr:RND efflux transporter [Klebsiella michiganensis]